MRIPTNFPQKKIIGILLASLAAMTFDISKVIAAPLGDLPPVTIGLSAEFGHKSSTSAQAIEMGILTALHEINKRGGVLGGRELTLQTHDNRSVPARGVAHLIQMSQDSDVVAVFGGKFSPVMLEMAPVANQYEMPLLDPWAAADAIVDNGGQPNYVFRLSLKDNWALPTMIRYARENGWMRVGLLLPNTGWGRSSEAAALSALKHSPKMTLTSTIWYNWGDKNLFDLYGAMLSGGADAILMVANESEGAQFVKAAATYPTSVRIPIVSHWGITGGDFTSLTGKDLEIVELSVVQTFTFVGRKDTKTEEVLAIAKLLFGIESYADIPSATGFANAYDLAHILANAIDIAGSTDRRKIRDGLEKVQNYRGLIRNYPQPFSPHSHEALDQSDIIIGRFRADGTLEPVTKD
tara:strand:- start:18040 stop:19263 length:1224 start_codon:yes stop_codon:yes gene_type:complete